MFEILKTVQNAATSRNYSGIMNVCGKAVTAVLATSPDKVEGINASKLKTFKKCDSSFRFSVYVDKPKSGTYYVVYVPRALSVWRTGKLDGAKMLRDHLNNLKQLISALEKENAKFFAAQLERLRDSVQKNPSYSDIHHAAACNFSGVIRKLCEDCVDGFLPLHIAVENESEEAVQMLLHFGADLTKLDCRSRNAIHYGAEKNPKILKLLAATPHFTDAVNMIDEDGLSPLCLAILSARKDCVEILLDARCSMGPFPGGPLAAMVTVAVSSPELPWIIDLLLERAPNFLTEQINGSSTILHEKLESRLLYHILCEVGGDAVNTNIRNGLGETPLFCAVSRNDLPQSIALLVNNADVNIPNCEGNTPLHVAAKSEEQKMEVLMVLKDLIQGDQRKSNNMKKNENVEMLKLLLCFGASVRCRNGRGATAMDFGKHSMEIANCLRMFAGSPVPTSNPLPDILSESMQERALKERRDMTLQQRKQLVNIISFDGGGIKGLVLLQTLLHIEKLLGHSVMEHFHWLCGTSTGAIIALTLAKGDTLSYCQNLYFRLKDEIFVGRRPYSEQIIEYFLQDHFGKETTMGQFKSKKVAVTASSVRTNPPVLKMFRSYTLPLSKAENSALGFDDPCGNVVWKCARYSSAAPTFFPPKDNFVDGGLMANNPTLDLMSDIHTYNAACIRVKKEVIRVGCILSLGTGQAPSEALDNMKFNFGLPRGISESVSMFRDLISLKNLLLEQITASDGACVKRARSWAHDQSIPFFRLSPHLSVQVELDEVRDEIIVDLLWDTEMYLRNEGKHDVENLVNYLKSL